MSGKSLGEIFNQQFVGGAMAQFHAGETPDQVVQRVPVVGGKELVCLFNFHADEREVTAFLVKNGKPELLGIKSLDELDATTINTVLSAKAKF